MALNRKLEQFFSLSMIHGCGLGQVPFPLQALILSSIKWPFFPSSTLMAGVTAMTSGSMPTTQTSTLQAGAPRQDIPWSLLSVCTLRTLCSFPFHQSLTTLSGLCSEPGVPVPLVPRTYCYTKPSHALKSQQSIQEPNLPSPVIADTQWQQWAQLDLGPGLQRTSFQY